MTAHWLKIWESLDLSRLRELHLVSVRRGSPSYVTSRGFRRAVCSDKSPYLSFCIHILPEFQCSFLFSDSVGFDVMSMALNYPLSLLDYHEKAVFL